jgi:hypothetical protein
MSITFHISPDGNDRNPGTADAPLATLHQARQAVRERIASFKPGEEQDIDIHLATGTHRLHETLVLDHRDSGSDRFKVRWLGAAGGGTVICSGHPLIGWRKLADEPAWLASAAKGRVWFIDLPAGSHVTTLYGTEGLIPRAKGQGIIPQRLSEKESMSCQAFAFPAGAIANAADLHEAECLIIPVYQWTMNILPVERVDFETNIVHLAEPCTYRIGVPHCAANGSIWLENSLSVLTPGSWVFHRGSARLYYCPEGDAPEEGLAAPLLTEFIRVEGGHDQGTGLLPVRQVHFEGITFTHSGRFHFHGGTGKGIQHDWEMHDAPSCMLRFRHVHESSVTRCRFVDAGAGGVRLDLAAAKNTIADCEFSRLGGCGVVLCGYGLSRNYLNRNNTVSRNHLHHLGLFYWHCPAIFIWQSGHNTIADNYLHDLPYTAIVCSGRTVYDRKGKSECSGTIDWEAVDAQCGKDYVHPPWYDGGITDWWRREPLMHSRDNLIEYNRIRDVMQIMGDGNGIYISGAGGGNVVRFNAVGPCPSPSMAEGIRCDDDQHHTLIHGNLIFGQGGMGTGITLKGINRVTNNILALPIVDQIARGMLSLETGPLNGTVFAHNIIYTSSLRQRFVAEMRIHGTGREARLRDAESDHNIYYCTVDPEQGRAWIAEQQGFGNDYASRACDPGFVDAEHGDFRLKPDAAARESGFKPLPLERMMDGCYHKQLSSTAKQRSKETA